MGSTDPSLSLPLAMSDLERARAICPFRVRDDERELVKWSYHRTAWRSTAVCHQD
jgi:hypothetical protein